MTNPSSPSRTETLRAYVQHLPSCPRHMQVRFKPEPGWKIGSHIKPCTCGLDAALAGPQEPSGWQPIETLSDEDAGKASVLVATPDGVGEAQYLGRENGWWWMNNDPGDPWGKPIYPTHWMPLPASPSTSTEQT